MKYSVLNQSISMIKFLLFLKSKLKSNICKNFGNQCGKRNQERSRKNSDSEKAKLIYCITDKELCS